jgi:hypothetical protein
MVTTLADVAIFSPLGRNSGSGKLFAGVGAYDHLGILKE